MYAVQVLPIVHHIHGVAIYDMDADAVVIACLGKAVGKGSKKEGQDGERHGVKLIFHGYQPLLFVYRFVYCFSKTSLS